MLSEKHTLPAAPSQGGSGMSTSQDERQIVVQNDEAKAGQPLIQDDVAEAIPSHVKIIKTFPPRGDWQQYRLATTTKFSCCGCQQPKTSKLVVTKEGKWSKLWCNGCYGLLVSDAPLKS
ncbi:hypothetical protein F5883DRAFT_576163 [Diaporthe sp. PMI_573]|nr:hypothetical protein F5883DRAFT_576163 [Diaporthaceae sp. PMI_573]